MDVVRWFSTKNVKRRQLPGQLKLYRVLFRNNLSPRAEGTENWLSNVYVTSYLMDCKHAHKLYVNDSEELTLIISREYYLVRDILHNLNTREECFSQKMKYFNQFKYTYFLGKRFRNLSCRGKLFCLYNLRNLFVLKK